MNQQAIMAQLGLVAAVTAAVTRKSAHADYTRPARHPQREKMRRRTTRLSKARNRRPR